MSPILFALTLATAIGCGAMGGVFVAFSTFVMKGLGRLPAAQAVAAMQAINVAAVTPPFMLGLFGTAAGSVAVSVAALITWGESFAPWLLAGGLLYLVGAIVLTMAYHVPRNNALAGIDPQAPGSEAHWGRYLREWTAMNHVRALAPLAAAAALTVALSLG